MDTNIPLELKASTDWDKVSMALSEKAYHVFGDNPYHDRGFAAFMSHLESQVKELSKLELAARRSHSHSLRNVNEQLEAVNKILRQFDQQMILVALSQPHRK